MSWTRQGSNRRAHWAWPSQAKNRLSALSAIMLFLLVAPSTSKPTDNRENTLVRDNAELASLEARYAVWRSAAGEDVVQAAAFADFGRGTNTNAASPDPDTLGSLGLGIIWNMFRGSRFEIYWGIPLDHDPRIRPSGGNLQDSGIHLQLIVEVL